jgi:hypothetical protein
MRRGSNEDYTALVPAQTQRQWRPSAVGVHRLLAILDFALRSNVSFSRSRKTPAPMFEGFGRLPYLGLRPFDA